MEKIKIGNTEFDLVPMGIGEDIVKKTRYFKFISNLDYAQVINLVSLNTDNIQHLDSEGNIINTYADIVAFKGLAFEKDVVIEDGVTSDVYTVTYGTDPIQKEINRLNNEVDDLSNTIVIISMQ